MPARRKQSTRSNSQRSRPNRDQSTRFFVGTEGQSEQALARWLESLSIQAGRRIWFDIRIANPGSGSTLDVVQRSIDNRNRSRRGPYAKTLVCLDEDRRSQDGPAAEIVARQQDVHLIWQRWNIEGLLLRLFPHQETRWPPANRTFTELRRHWPDYAKNRVSALDLRERFSIHDLQRAARFDQNLQALLEILQLERL